MIVIFQPGSLLFPKGVGLISKPGSLKRLDQCIEPVAYWLILTRTG